MLGQKRQPGLVERPLDAFMDGAKARDGGKQAQPAAAGGQEQLAIGGRHLVRVVAVDVADDQHPGQGGVVEG